MEMCQKLKAITELERSKGIQPIDHMQRSQLVRRKNLISLIVHKFRTFDPYLPYSLDDPIVCKIKSINNRGPIIELRVLNDEIYGRLNFAESSLIFTDREITPFLESAVLFIERLSEFALEEAPHELASRKRSGPRRQARL
jgi:hypothetical protein